MVEQSTSPVNPLKSGRAALLWHGAPRRSFRGHVGRSRTPRLENAGLVVQLERALQQSMTQQQQAMQAQLQLQLLQQQQPPPPPRTSPFEPQVGPCEPAQLSTMLAVQTWVSIWHPATIQKIYDIFACLPGVMQKTPVTLLQQTPIISM